MGPAGDRPDPRGRVRARRRWGARLYGRRRDGTMGGMTRRGRAVVIPVEEALAWLVEPFDRGEVFAAPVAAHAFRLRGGRGVQVCKRHAAARAPLQPGLR